MLQLCQYPWTPILAISPISGKVKIYHNFANLGGTRTRTDSKIVVLEGLGPNATPLFFPAEGLSDMSDYKYPSSTSLMDITSADDFSALPPYGNT